MQPYGALRGRGVDGDQAEPGEVLQGAAGLLPVGCRVAAGAPGNEFPGQLAGEDRPRYAVRV
jgi:hypothetical protein